MVTYLSSMNVTRNKLEKKKKGPSSIARREVFRRGCFELRFVVRSISFYCLVMEMEIIVLEGV